MFTAAFSNEINYLYLRWEGSRLGHPNVVLPLSVLLDTFMDKNYVERKEIERRLPGYYS